MRVISLIPLLLLASCAPSPRQLDHSARDTAALRGLRFLEQIASHPQHFKDYGPDLLWAFYTLSEASADPLFKQEARTFGAKLARQWRGAHPAVPPNAGINQIYDYIAGSETADDLGVIDDPMRHELARQAGRFSPGDWLRFNPRIEPPPTDIPHPCSRCKHANHRGTKNCRKCGEPLHMVSPYDILFDALVTTYAGHHYGVRLGAEYANVARWIPSLRPYPVPSTLAADPNVTYTITHIIYTLNDYDQYRLRPEWLPQEFAFLKAHAQMAIDEKDAETLGEFIDSLQVFGMTDKDPQVRKGIDYLLAHQNADGSWGEIQNDDIYTRYHTTWTGIGGVMRYAWRGERLAIPDALPALLSAQPRITP